MSFEKRILVKTVSYRFYDNEDKHINKYYIQVAKDEHNNPYDIEISYKQFRLLLEDGAISCLTTAKTTLPTLNNEMPAFRYHSISVSVYEFKDRFETRSVKKT